MSDLRSMSREFLTEFIELYRDHYCLWQIKCKEYSNKYLKNLAYEQLVKKLSEVEPNATKDSVVKRINSLRTCFRKEHRKVIQSSKSGDENIFTPSLWYYDLLLFVADQDIPRKSILNQTEDKTEDNETSEEQNTQYNAFCEIVTQNSTPDLETDILSSAGSCTSPSALKKISNKQRINRNRKAEKVLDIVAEKLQRPNEQQLEYEHFGKHIAEQLRKVSKDQAIYLAKIINDGIFEAQCGCLTRNSKVTTSPIYGRETTQESRINYLHRTI